jgi:peptide/nickel transport system substrate-binding protein
MTWFPAQWSGDLVGLEGMPNPSNFKVKAMDDLQDKILDTMTPEQAITAWGEFDKLMETEYYPAVNLGYSGTAMIHGSKIGGMANDNIRGMPTFARMYITQ